MKNSTSDKKMSQNFGIKFSLPESFLPKGRSDQYRFRKKNPRKKNHPKLDRKKTTGRKNEKTQGK